MQRIIYYKGYEIKDSTVNYIYSANNKNYTNTICFPPQLELKNLNKKALFDIGIVFLTYMYALDDFDQIVIKDAVNFRENDLYFFEKLFKYGLAEFRYKNGLRYDRDIAIEVDNTSEETDRESNLSFMYEKGLLLAGGGKDSVVSAELLKELEMDFDWFTLNAVPSVMNCARESQNKNVVNIVWKIDKQVFADRKYRGHKPFSALLAFISYLYAKALNYKWLISSNEYSSNFGNVVTDTIEINHQYSKSINFEHDFRKYTSEHYATGPDYFSILRPLYEIQIAKIFSYYPQYFRLFNSCNNGLQKDYWCKECSKCVFIYLILYPFIDTKYLDDIFGQDFLEDEKNLSILNALVNPNTKPFDCVGTDLECKAAITLSKRKNPDFLKENYDFKTLYLPENWEDIMSETSRESFIPQTLLSSVNKFYQQYLP